MIGSSYEIFCSFLTEQYHKDINLDVYYSWSLKDLDFVPLSYFLLSDTFILVIFLFYSYKLSYVFGNSWLDTLI